MRTIRKALSAVGWFAFALAMFCFLAALLSGCGTKNVPCAAYHGGRTAACAACNLLPEECPFDTSGGENELE